MGVYGSHLAMIAKTKDVTAKYIGMVIKGKLLVRSIQAHSPKKMSEILGRGKGCTPDPIR